MRYQVRMHPTLDVLVSSIGEVFVPASAHHKAHWTFGYKDGGYLRVRINGKMYQLHRLVAQTYLPNPKNKPEVDHINRNTADNRVSPACKCNLRWATRSENSRNRKCCDLVSARGEKHLYDYEDKKQYRKERNAQRHKTHKDVRFSDGKRRYIPNAEALVLLALPVSQRIYTKQ